MELFQIEVDKAAIDAAKANFKTDHFDPNQWKLIYQKIKPNGLESDWIPGLKESYNLL